MRKRMLTLLAAISILSALSAASLWPLSHRRRSVLHVDLLIGRFAIEASAGQFDVQFCPTLGRSAADRVWRAPDLVELVVGRQYGARIVPGPGATRRSLRLWRFAVEHITVTAPADWTAILAANGYSGAPPRPSEWFGVSFPAWFAIVMGLVPAFLWYRVRVHTPRHRLRHGLCVNCGYDLRASAGVCPECGHAIGPAAACGASPMLVRFRLADGRDNMRDGAWEVGVAIVYEAFLILIIASVLWRGWRQSHIVMRLLLIAATALHLCALLAWQDASLWPIPALAAPAALAVVLMDWALERREPRVVQS